MPLADVTLTAPVKPRQVLQAGANYRQHVIELVAAGLTKNSDRTPEEAREFAAKMMDDRARERRAVLLHRPARVRRGRRRAARAAGATATCTTGSSSSRS